MKKNIVLLSVSTICIILIALFLDACKGCQPIANRIQDSDQDHWFDSTSNIKAELFIDSIIQFVSIGGGGIFSGSVPSNLKITVDDHIINGIELNGDIIRMDFQKAVTERYLGDWRFSEEAQNLKTKIIFNGDEFNLIWKPKDTSIIINTGTSIYRVRIKTSLFADPSPNNAAGDFDLDNIPDSMESKIARANNNLGNPLGKDLIVAVVLEDNDDFITANSITKITTMFRQHDIHLKFVDEANELFGITPYVHGEIDTNLNFDSIGQLRARAISIHLNPFVRMLFLSDKSTGCGQFGCARFPNFIVRSRMFGIRDESNFQAGVIMHELGHTLGLCHPTETGNGCDLPITERDPGITCMGAPAENFLGIVNPVSIFQAFNRPLDYTPTQWNRVKL